MVQKPLYPDTHVPLKDAEFMTAKEKANVLKQWTLFMKSGCAKEKFTKPIYKHLTLHCSFIAHYDIHGFYGCYFTEPENTIKFLTQFDTRGDMKSVEYGWTSWLTDREYNDINSEMCRIATVYIPAMTKQLSLVQEKRDIARAEALLAKHGLKADIKEG